MKIVECPRDAMQGVTKFIPTTQKIKYLNQLLKVGFDTLDCGSFVSPKAVPQMKDTAEVLDQLDLSNTDTRLLVIVANLRGAEDASKFKNVDYLGFPLSVSETFQRRNTNKSIEEAFDLVTGIREICGGSNQELVVYLSMGFGNPYGDPYSMNLLEEFSERLVNIGVNIISIADTVGTGAIDQIDEIFPKLMKQFPSVEFGAHLHSRPEEAVGKIRAVIKSGCQRLDGALLGYGGCPMAKDDLVGNIATELILDEVKDYNKDELVTCLSLARTIFN